MNLCEIHARMKAVAAVAGLPLQAGSWRGTSGSVLGGGTGSSLDFQDHRHYVPGDDPRHINWQAYARTGHYTLKLYREEVTPRIDLVFDVSGSMFLNEPKASRVWELVYFCLESGLRIGGHLKLFLLGRSAAELPEELPVDQAVNDHWPATLGLSYWQTQRKIVLPQALALVVPGIMNNFISIFKDTSLVTIVSLYELTGALGLALNSDADWRPFKIEGYLFIALIYFIFCFSMSRYSLWVEKQVNKGKQR